MQTIEGKRFVRIALTGGIAAGKSTVAARMAQDGADVIDYDFLAHILQEPCSPAINPLVEAFGPGILNDQGGVDRRALAKRVFGDGAPQSAVATLNGIMHPQVYELARNREHVLVGDGCSHVIVHDVPLLGEVMEMIPFAFDAVACVVAPRQVKLMESSPSVVYENVPSNASSSLRNFASAFSALTTGRLRFSSISAVE